MIRRRRFPAAAPAAALSSLRPARSAMAADPLSSAPGDGDLAARLDRAVAEKRVWTFTGWSCCAAAAPGSNDASTGRIRSATALSGR
ncbi:hypothetical protein M446_2326 [Methylobacterium sp. 4-46]|uniref:hypothetical protein n=1 Tax=unclassified Methylobacterium TaxID=2615210 RepID=UPI000165C69A|nr:MULTISPECIES: hypothetical protein [Methylobacterium]ACA16785.1 hypothetical protein M446_2326 [Methylobacterium sp. 4-46]WFT82481.1 hypothetical protein QA634_11785 [Methylobacterium nodulans]